MVGQSGGQGPECLEACDFKDWIVPLKIAQLGQRQLHTAALRHLSTQRVPLHMKRIARRQLIDKLRGDVLHRLGLGQEKHRVGRQIIKQHGAGLLRLF